MQLFPLRPEMLQPSAGVVFLMAHRVVAQNTKGKVTESLSPYTS